MVVIRAVVLPVALSVLVVNIPAESFFLSKGGDGCRDVRSLVVAEDLPFRGAGVDVAEAGNEGGMGIVSVLNPEE